MIEILWEANPDIRLGQLLSNVILHGKKSGKGTEVDLFYLEDSELEDYLNQYFMNEKDKNPVESN